MGMTTLVVGTRGTTDFAGRSIGAEHFGVGRTASMMPDQLADDPGTKTPEVGNCMTVDIHEYQHAA